MQGFLILGGSDQNNPQRPTNLLGFQPRKPPMNTRLSWAIVMKKLAKDTLERFCDGHTNP